MDAVRRRRAQVNQSFDPKQTGEIVADNGIPLLRRKLQFVNSLDWGIGAHVERMVSSQDNMVGTNPVYQETQGLDVMSETVAIDIGQICRWRFWQPRAQLRTNIVAVIESSELIGQKILRHVPVRPSVRDSARKRPTATGVRQRWRSLPEIQPDSTNDSP